MWLQNYEDCNTSKIWNILILTIHWNQNFTEYSLPYFADDKTVKQCKITIDNKKSKQSIVPAVTKRLNQQFTKLNDGLQNKMLAQCLNYPYSPT